MKKSFLYLKKIRNFLGEIHIRLQSILDNILEMCRRTQETYIAKHCQRLESVANTSYKKHFCKSFQVFVAYKASVSKSIF